MHNWILIQKVDNKKNNSHFIDFIYYFYQAS